MLRLKYLDLLHLDLLQSSLRTKLKIHSHLSKNLWINSVVSFLCFQSLELTILSSHKNVGNMLCLIMKILTEKKLL